MDWGNERKTQRESEKRMIRNAKKIAPHSIDVRLQLIKHSKSDEFFVEAKSAANCLGGSKLTKRKLKSRGTLWAHVN